MASRYANIQTITYNNKTILSSAKIKPASFFQQYSPTVIKVQENDTLDKLAFEFYDNDGSLWWIIAYANGLELPTDINPGDKLVVPTDYKSIISALNNINAS